MSEGVLKAIKDWCRGRFQAKGEYLTEIPEEYVTETKLAKKNYATKDELSDNAGMTTETVEELINDALLENTGGAKIAQDAEGNWGLLAPGADTVTPFSKGGGGSLSEIEFPFYNLGITQPMYYAAPNTIILRLTKTFPMKKIVVSGIVAGKTTSTSYTRSVSGRFTFYNKNEDGSMGASETITLGTLTVSGTSSKTVTFNEVEIDLESIYFEDAVDSTNNPQFLLSLGGSYAYGYFYFTKMKGYL